MIRVRCFVYLVIKLGTEVRGRAGGIGMHEHDGRKPCNQNPRGKSVRTLSEVKLKSARRIFFSSNLMTFQ